MSDTTADRPTRPVGLGFAAAYSLAQIGAFIAFAPLLQVLIPIKATAIDPAHKTEVQAAIFFWGAITASVANLAAGVISDRTRSRFGRRRPWLAIGLVGSLFSYLVIFLAHTPLALIAGVVSFQLIFNFLFAALGAILPDRVPDAQKGKIAAAASLGFPVGSFVGMTLVGRFFHDEPGRFLALGFAVTLALAPLILCFREAPSTEAAPQARSWSGLLRSLWVDPRAHRDFAFAWMGRFLVIMAYSIVQGFGLFYLQDWIHYDRVFPSHNAEEGYALLTAAACATSVVTAFCCGVLSDRIGRRKVFVAVGAVILALSMAMLAQAHSWPVVVAAYVVQGLGTGCFYTVDMALVAQVLPKVEDAGKDLGIVNLSNTLPQVVASGLANWFLVRLHAGYGNLLLCVALLAFCGGMLVLPIRRVR